MLGLDVLQRSYNPLQSPLVADARGPLRPVRARTDLLELKKVTQTLDLALDVDSIALERPDPVFVRACVYRELIQGFCISAVAAQRGWPFARS